MGDAVADSTQSYWIACVIDGDIIQYCTRTEENSILTDPAIQFGQVQKLNMVEVTLLELIVTIFTV